MASRNTLEAKEQALGEASAALEQVSLSDSSTHIIGALSVPPLKKSKVVIDLPPQPAASSAASAAAPASAPDAGLSINAFRSSSPQRSLLRRLVEHEQKVITTPRSESIPRGKAKAKKLLLGVPQNATILDKLIAWIALKLRSIDLKIFQRKNTLNQKQTKVAAKLTAPLLREDDREKKRGLFEKRGFKSTKMTPKQ